METKKREEIKKIIENNNKRIEELIIPGTFVLNKEIQALMEENTILRENCDHEIEEGFCKWCGVPEELIK